MSIAFKCLPIPNFSNFSFNSVAMGFFDEGVFSFESMYTKQRDLMSTIAKTQWVSLRFTGISFISFFDKFLKLICLFSAKWLYKYDKQIKLLPSQGFRKCSILKYGIKNPTFIPRFFVSSERNASIFELVAHGWGWFFSATSGTWISTGPLFKSMISCSPFSSSVFSNSLQSPKMPWIHKISASWSMSSFPL